MSQQGYPGGGGGSSRFRKSSSRVPPGPPQKYPARPPLLSRGKMFWRRGFLCFQVVFLRLQSHHQEVQDLGDLHKVITQHHAIKLSIVRATARSFQMITLRTYSLHVFGNHYDSDGEKLLCVKYFTYAL